MRTEQGGTGFPGSMYTWKVWLQFRGNQQIRLVWLQPWEKQCPEQPQSSKEIENRRPADMLD